MLALELHGLVFQRTDLESSRASQGCAEERQGSRLDFPWDKAAGAEGDSGVTGTEPRNKHHRDSESCGKVS